jgi:hypothetical protein
MTATITELESNRAQLEAQMLSFDILGHALKAGRATDRLRQSLINDYGYTNVPIDRYLDQYAQAVSDDVLDVATDIRGRLVLVLCTGGPHCEIVGNRVICYGWFGSDEVSRKLKASERRALDYLFA